MEDENRLRKIIHFAEKLNWIIPPLTKTYPLMQLSEVEKCMLAMVDDKELSRMEKWAEEKEKENHKNFNKNLYSKK